MESRRKWRGVENFPPVKKAQWGQYSPLSPSSVLAFFPAASATARWTEWAKGIVASPACGNSAGPRSFHGSLCEHMRAERARCLGMIWLSWPCGSSPAAGVWEWRSPPPPPPWKHTAHIDTHTPVNQQANVQPVDGAVYTSRLFDKPPPNSRVYEFGARRRVCGSIRRNRWLLSLLLHTKLLQWSDHIESRCEWANNWFP